MRKLSISKDELESFENYFNSIKNTLNNKVKSTLGKYIEVSGLKDVSWTENLEYGSTVPLVVVADDCVLVSYRVDFYFDASNVTSDFKKNVYFVADLVFDIEFKPGYGLSELLGIKKKRFSVPFCFNREGSFLESWIKERY